MDKQPDNRLKEIILRFEQNNFLERLEGKLKNDRAFADYQIKKFMVDEFYRLVNKEALENPPSYE